MGNAPAPRSRSVHDACTPVTRRTRILLLRAPLTLIGFVRLPVRVPRAAQATAPAPTPVGGWRDVVAVPNLCRTSAAKFELVRLGLPEGVSFEQEPGRLEPGVERHAGGAE